MKVSLKSKKNTKIIEGIIPGIRNVVSKNTSHKDKQPKSIKASSNNIGQNILGIVYKPYTTHCLTEMNAFSNPVQRCILGQAKVLMV